MSSTTTHRTAAALAAAVALAAALLIVAAHTRADATTTPQTRSSAPALASVAAGAAVQAGTVTPPVWQTTPCAVEDASDCFWDATKAGNGVGESFYAVRVGHGRVCVLYWSGVGNFCTTDPYPPTT